MPYRHPARPIPRSWLMTDERMGDALWPALMALPRGAGVVFRHHATPAVKRQILLDEITKIAKHRRLVLVVAGEVRPRRHAAGWHGRDPRHTPGLRSWPAHSRAEAVAGVRAGADLIMVSPVFATRSHPGAPALGPIRAALIARGLGVPVIALGGVDGHRYRRLQALGFFGWAAIDAWADQKRNAVPI